MGKRQSYFSIFTKIATTNPPQLASDPDTITELEKERLNMIMVEYQKINSGIDERVKMVDSLTNLSLLITAGYLTALSVINPTVKFSYEVNGIVAIGVILMQYFITLQILRSDYLMLNLVEYYYIEIRHKVAKILHSDDTGIWGYENYKYGTMSQSLFEKIQFNVLSLMRFGIPFASCVLIGLHFYFVNAEKVIDSANAVFTISIMALAVLLTIILFGVMLRWAWFSTSRTSLLVVDYDKRNNETSKNKLAFVLAFIILSATIIFLFLLFIYFLLNKTMVV